jgi:hypothetical protein
MRVPVAKNKRYVVNAYQRYTVCVLVPGTYMVPVLSLKRSTRTS